MRTIIASRIFAPEAAAASFRLAALAQSLHYDGADVTVLTSKSPEGSETGMPEGITVRRAPVLRDKTGAVRGYIQYLSFDIPLFFRLLFARRPDVVVVEPPPTTGAAVKVVCALRRIPYVYYAADVLSDAAELSGSPALIVRAVRALEGWVLRGAAAVLSVSEGVTSRLAGFGVSASVQTVGNGVDTTQFTPEGVVHDLGSPYFLYAGTASEIHGASVFVKAFDVVLESHPNAKLVFMGQGSDIGEHAERAKGLPEGSVVFEPRRTAEETAAWLRGAVVSLASIVPGQGYDFSFPTKIFAAVACGTPVVYAGGGPARRFMADAPAGWAVDYDATAVAAAMREAVSLTPPARATLARWGADRVSLKIVARKAAAVVNLVASAD